MAQGILVTGAEGLVGRALGVALRRHGFSVRGLDLRARGEAAGDVRDAGRVRTAAEGCSGIVHLAAVSRVVLAERDPDACWATNVGGLRNVIDAALARPKAPWVVFASSREVYGQSPTLPVTEDAPLRPVNAYGRSKVEGERLMAEAKASGLRGCVVRLSNVFGSVRDHPDRVVPAFARAAARGLPLRVEGEGNTFDFTHVADVTKALLIVARRFANGQDVPAPLHFVTGRPTTLAELASLAVGLGGRGSLVCHGPTRSFDVARYYGCPERARVELGWTSHISLREGLRMLIRALRRSPLSGRHRCFPVARQAQRSGGVS